LKKKGVDINSLDDKLKYNALHQASLNNKVECGEYLISKGSNIEAVDKFGNTALILAARKGHAAFVNLLLKNSANINAINLKGNTALHAAVKANNPETLDTLLTASNIIIDISNSKGETAIIMSIRLNFDKCSKLLQQHIGYNLSKSSDKKI